MSVSPVSDTAKPFKVRTTTEGVLLGAYLHETDMLAAVERANKQAAELGLVTRYVGSEER